MRAKRNVPVCKGHELANALYVSENQVFTDAFCCNMMHGHLIAGRLLSSELVKYITVFTFMEANQPHFLFKASCHKTTFDIYPRIKRVIGFFKTATWIMILTILHKTADLSVPFANFDKLYYAAIFNVPKRLKFVLLSRHWEWFEACFDAGWENRCSAILQKLWQAGHEQNIVQLSCVTGNFAELVSLVWE